MRRGNAIYLPSWPAGPLSPGSASAATMWRRLQRRVVDGAIHHPRASGRRLDGERDGLELQGTAASATAGLPAMAPMRSGAHGAPLASPDLKKIFPGQGG